MISEKKKYSMGWLPNYPDFRDYLQETAEVRAILEPTGLPARVEALS